MSAETTPQGWLSRQAEKEARRDRISLGERLGQGVGIVIIVLIVLFFFENQVKDTGFFTSEFNTIDAILFYGTLLFGIIPALLKLVIGRRNMVRPVEVANSILFAIAAAWFLMSFPFDFSKLTSLFSQDLKFVLDWLSNDLVKLFLVFALIVTILSAAYTTAVYLAVRKVLKRQSANLPKHT